MPTPIFVGEKGAKKSANPAESISMMTIVKPIKPLGVDNSLMKNDWFLVFNSSLFNFSDILYIPV